MRGSRTALLLVSAHVAACAGSSDRHTLAELRDVEPDLRETPVENSLDQAILGYRRFLEEAPESALTPEAMRRLADLKLEKEYGLLGDGKIVEVPAPEEAARPPEAAALPAPEAPAAAPRAGAAPPADRPRAAGIADHSES